MRFVIFARVLPRSSSSASCVGRTFTSANSAATKKPFASTNTNARIRYQTGMEGALFYGLFQSSPETGVGLRDDLFLCDGDVAAREAGNGEGHGDAMVVVRLDDRGLVAPARLDQQRVGALLDRRAEAAQLGSDGREAIGLLHAQVRDVHDLDGR